MVCEIGVEGKEALRAACGVCCGISTDCDVTAQTLVNKYRRHVSALQYQYKPYAPYLIILSAC